VKVLLASLNSKYIHSNLALKYLYITVPKNDAFFEIKEFTINNDESYVFSEILAGKYDVICFSCYIWNIEETLYLAENIKKANPNVIMIFGGPEVSYDTKELMEQNDVIDFVVMGEGEYTFSRLMETLIAANTQSDIQQANTQPSLQNEDIKTSDYENIKGLAYRKNGDIVVNEAMELLVFETVPFPYSVLPCEQDKIIYYQSSRGCPFNCSYCISSLEKKLRALPIERVFQDMDYFLANKVKQVKFIDRTFNWDSARCNEIIKYIIERDNGITNFHFEICGEFIDDELIGLLKTARDGLFKFEVGIQSTHRKTLAAVRRSSEAEKVLANTKKLTELDNVHVHVDLIAGLPFEDYNRFKVTFNDAYNLFANTLQLGFLKMLKGTEICENAENYNYKYRSKAPYEVISNMFLSAQDLCRLKQVENAVDLYYNRKKKKNTLEYIIETFVETPFEFFEEFAIFFNLKGFQHQSHKKEDVYRILYEYGEWKTKKMNISSDELLSNLTRDMHETLNPDAVKKFERKGWQYV
jgi:radical SAM superfamily enzyme YgiQ (UPF0313 family)